MTPNFDRAIILGAYKRAERRILFLDYDGTLVPFSDLPGDSILGEQVRSIIIDLTKDPKNRVYIISGRDKQFLTDQFFGINAGLIAEHGFLVKEDGGDWKCTIDIDNTWRKAVSSLFQEFYLRFPGSFIEEKESSFAYHYRTAAQEVGYKIRPAIRKQFLILRKKYPELELLDGAKVIEIKPGNFNKGKIASKIIRSGKFDFIMAAGDDHTDELLFNELDNDSFTIKVGLQPTRARYRIPSQEKFIEFLAGLLQEVN